MNLNLEEKKSSVKLLAILLLVYAGIRMLSMIGGYNTFLSWINVLCWTAMGIILLVKDIDKKYIAIPFGIVTLISAYNFISILGQIEVPFLFKYWYLPAIFGVASLIIRFIGGFLCRMFY